MMEYKNEKANLQSENKSIQESAHLNFVKEANRDNLQTDQGDKGDVLQSDRKQEGSTLQQVDKNIDFKDTDEEENEPTYLRRPLFRYVEKSKRRY